VVVSTAERQEAGVVEAVLEAVAWEVTEDTAVEAVEAAEAVGRLLPAFCFINS
jgi:hypothetical protein